MKDFAKSIRTGNAKKEDIIREKKAKGVYLEVDNGQKIEFSDGTTYAKSTGSDDYREVHNYVGNSFVRSYKKDETTDAQIDCNEDGTDADLTIYENGREKESKHFSTIRDAEQYIQSHGFHRTLNKKTVNSKVGNLVSDSYEFIMSAGKNDYESIKKEVAKAGGWTPEIKSKAEKTVSALRKKAEELVKTAHKQSNDIEKLANDIEGI